MPKGGSTCTEIFALIEGPGIGSEVGISAAGAAGSLAVGSADSLVVVSAPGAASFPRVPTAVAPFGTGTSFGVSKTSATSLIAPIRVVGSAPLDVSEMSDANASPAFSFRPESGATTTPTTSAISAAAAAAA